jgi:hypothetical protein
VTRFKEPEVLALADTMASFEQGLASYRWRLSEELAAEVATGSPYGPLVSGLERQIAMLDALAYLVDDDVWEHLLLITNMSASITHRRTRRFF